MLLEICWAGGSVVSQIAPAELGFENPTVSQHIFSHRATLLPCMLAFLVIGNSYETLMTN